MKRNSLLRDQVQLAMVYEPSTHAQMQLFWHNHFTTELRKVKFAELMWKQHQLIHQHAGKILRITDAMVHDPAMQRYLDNLQNTKEKPNRILPVN